MLIDFANSKRTFDSAANKSICSTIQSHKNTLTLTLRTITLIPPNQTKLFHIFVIQNIINGQ